MKTGMIIMILNLAGFFNMANAQSLKKDKAAEKIAITKNLVDSQNFVFVPQFMSPSRGGNHNLTSYYSLQVSKDTIISYLPYFGRAYTAPMGSNDNGFDFTSTKFEYSVTPGKKDSWSILIKPKDNLNGQQLILKIFSNSSASLNITSLNRDPISYQGYITPKKQQK